MEHKHTLNQIVGRKLIDMYNIGMRFKLIWVSEDGKSIIISPMSFPLTILLQLMPSNKMHCTLQLLFQMHEFYFETADDIRVNIQNFLVKQLAYVENHGVIDNIDFMVQNQLPNLSTNTEEITDGQGNEVEVSTDKVVEAQEQPEEH